MSLAKACPVLLCRYNTSPGVRQGIVFVSFDINPSRYSSDLYFKVYFSYKHWTYIMKGKCCFVDSSVQQFVNAKLFHIIFCCIFHTGQDKMNLKLKKYFCISCNLKVMIYNQARKE